MQPDLTSQLAYAHAELSTFVAAAERVASSGVAVSARPGIAAAAVALTEGNVAASAAAADATPTLLPKPMPQYVHGLRRAPLWGVWSDQATEQRWLAGADRRFREWAAANAAAAGAATSAANYAAAQTIPKLVHHIWLGSPLPARAAVLRATWRRHHPPANGWRHLLWDDAAVARVLAESRAPKPRKTPAAAAAAAAAGAAASTASARGGAAVVSSDSLGERSGAAARASAAEAFPAVRVANLAAYDAATNWGEKSDVLRYEILNQASHVGWGLPVRKRAAPRTPRLGNTATATPKGDDQIATSSVFLAGRRLICGHGLQVPCAVRRASYFKPTQVLHGPVQHRRRRGGAEV
jgi:hypothetical protein